jgi:hypothetical protein
MKRIVSLLMMTCFGARAQADAAVAPITFTFPAAPAGQPLDGRLLFLLSTDPADEPRNQIDPTVDSQLVFGTDVENLRGRTLSVPVDALIGYPIRSLRDVPPGEYHVQAVLHRYETVHRSDGHTLKLPMDRGEGQKWNRAPGNLYSKPVKVRVKPGAALRIVLDQTMSPIEPPKDTKYVRHVTIQSKLLSEFWGRPIELTAHVLLPKGFDEHPNARFPLVVAHDHHRGDFPGFRTEPPDPDLKPDYSERFHLAGYNRIEQQEAYAFYQQWVSKDFPRLLIIYIDHANPYYDDSYAVDSPNVGPYGRAIHTELIPAIEKQFRAIGQGWARFAYGGSTGGWEALAGQVFNPDFYNGAFAACPDPIDFRGFTNIDVYAHKNAYYIDGKHQRVLQPGQQDADGRTLATIKSNNELEQALGSRGRSGEQWDIWQAVYGPVGTDGYPRPVFDKETGVIDPEVAKYWREHSDLSAIVKRDWATLASKLRGKMHVYVGTSDTFFLANGVYYFEEMLKTLDPPADAEIVYGLRFEHCWNGDPTRPNHLTRLRYHTLYVTKMLERMQKTAPKGADLSSWRY